MSTRLQAHPDSVEQKMVLSHTKHHDQTVSIITVLCT